MNSDKIEQCTPTSQPIGLGHGLLIQLRPKQWTKNLLVFGSAIFSGNLLHSEIMWSTGLAFICFSLAASSVYILNDIIDVDKDRLHPEKSKRPIPSGTISIPLAKVYGTALFFISVSLGYNLGSQFFGILLFYVFVNLFYSIWLKHVVIIDVMIIALGFVLRAISGAMAAGDKFTPWFILCTLMISLFLALGKRRYELELFNGDETKQRKVLSYYSTALLDQLITIVAAMTITSYSLYTATEFNANNQSMMLTIPFVLYGMFRYLYLIHIEKAGGKPEEVLLNDKHIATTVMLFGLSVLLIKNYF